MSRVEACECNRMVYPGKVGRTDKGGETKIKDKDRIQVLLIKDSK